METNNQSTEGSVETEPEPVINFVELQLLEQLRIARLDRFVAELDEPGGCEYPQKQSEVIEFIRRYPDCISRLVA